MVRIRRERGEKTYPKRFNFNIVRTGVIPFEERMKQAQREAALWRSREQGRQKAKQNRSKPQQQQHQLESHDHSVDSGDMEIEATSTPVHKNTNRSAISTLASGTGTSWGPSGLTPKKNAFRQYRTPNTKLVTQRKPSIVMDHDMETDSVSAPAPAPALTPMPVPVTTEGKSKVDMDVDQMRQSMARLMIPRLMIPRSVANKMRQNSGKHGNINDQKPL
ncbi:hypothetical protein BGZ65_002996 [Modicella reniformis]|uniref:Uncharacterized protein n=1 Tax=Modicella reniformis TaxID=1440133 RepID=A0A9P6MHY3_9FUNG|nr:hypothetical protein BGZ65_002996 [Modicella reniformis]